MFSYRSIKKVIIILSFLITYEVAFAADSEDRKHSTSILAHAGQTSFSGALSDSSGSSWGMSVFIQERKPDLIDALKGISAFWIIDIAGASGTVKDDVKFPFEAEDSFSTMGFTILPTFCAMATLPVQACLSIGFLQLQVDDTNNEQNYGTIRYDFRLGHFSGDGLVGGLEVNYYSVDQEVSGERSQFSALTYQGGIGWQW